jgi:integrase
MTTMDLFEYADRDDHQDRNRDEGPEVLAAPADDDDPTGPTSLLPPVGAAAAADLRETVITLADALRAAETMPDVTPDRLADLRSAIASFVRLTGRDSETMPIAPMEMVPALKKVRPGLFRLTAKRWGNVRGSLAGLAALVGWHADRERLRRKVTGPWGDLLALLTRAPQKYNLAGFARFCVIEGISPACVDEATVEAYRAWRTTATYDLHPNGTIHGLRRIWNAHAGTTPGWPDRKLSPPKDPRVFALPLAAFPASFEADLDGFVEEMRNPDPFGDKRAMADNTWQDRRGHLIRVASILVQEGHLKAEDVTGLTVLVTPAAMRIALRVMHRKAGGKWNGNAQDVAITLLDIARRWVKLDEHSLEALQALRNAVKVGPRGVGSRSMRRLEAFDDPIMMKRFFKLPTELFRAADRLQAEGRPDESARLHERALALAILQHQPLRRRTLALIDVEKHFRRDVRGRIVTLSIPGALVKNGIDISAPIPDELGRRIGKHIRVHLPYLKGDSTGNWLFPGSTGAGHKEPGTLAKGVVKEVERALGVEFSLHMVRHIAAMVLYDSSPDAGPVAQRLLAHRQLSTTEGFYGRLKTRSAHRVWGEMLDTMRTKTTLKERRAKARAGAERAS